jgi:hypothetical protein
MSNLGVTPGYSISPGLLPINLERILNNPTAEHAGGNACVVSPQDNV